MFKKYILPFIALNFFRFLIWTWKVEFVEHESFKKMANDKVPLVFGHWHGDELALLPLVPRYNMCAMVSTSADGDLMNHVFKGLGGETARGSSTRGAVQGLKGLVRLLKSGRMTTIAVDGPKGPIYKVKPGVFELSRLTGAYVVPMAASASKAHVFEKAWNKTFLPLFGSKVVITVGEPTIQVQKSDDPHSEELKEKFAQQIFDAKHQASKIIATI